MAERELYDLLVVGGGINGAGIARDAAGRGLRVLLAERDDLAAHTSSNSTKLIHGGLRYLEQHEFGLVRKALRERELLLAAAPHILRPLRFIVPVEPTMRPAPVLRAGLWLYDHLARRELLPASAMLRLPGSEAGAPLREDLGRAFAYADVWADDARLVVLTALDARLRGASIHPRTACVAASRGPSSWRITLDDGDGRREVHARALVDAAGPWAGALRGGNGGASPRRLRLVKGSHIVVPRLYAHDDAYLFQGEDGRVVFAIPYEDEFTLIGTTDVDYDGEPGEARIDAGETAYLCALASHYFRRPLVPADVAWSYSGVRPLLDDGATASAVTRDYELELDTAGAPLLTVWGGKLTTFRALAEQAVDQLAPRLGCRAPAWTRGAPLPGGDLPRVAGADLPPGSARRRRSHAQLVAAHAARHQALVDAVRRQRPWLPGALVARWVRAYGTRTELLLAQAGTWAAQRGTASSGRRPANAAGGTPAELGEEVLPGLFEAEIRYLQGHEWARTAEDILWRRSKLGLHLPPGSAQRLDDWLARARGAFGASAA